jgi:hypothetical protein
VLFESLLGDGSIGSLFTRSLMIAAQADASLRLRLRIDTPRLAQLPWELLWDPGEKEFLLLSRKRPTVSLVRYPQQGRALVPLTVKPPLEVLGLIAAPRQLPGINVARERERIDTALQPLVDEGVVRVTWLDGGPTWHDLQQALSQREWHILHFIGHGGFDTRQGEGLVYLADEDAPDAARALSARGLSSLLVECESLRMVLLNACEGGREGDSQSFASIAATLSKDGIPAVVAMQYPISDAAAIAFGRAFYEQVARWEPVDAAVARARKAVRLDESTLEWATPVLHLRTTDANLFAREVRRARPSADSPSDVVPGAYPAPAPSGRQRPFSGLADGIAGLPGSPVSGCEQFLSEYLGTPAKGVPFGGRDEELRMLDTWLLDAEQPYGLLVAGAGRGKSALVAQWASRVAGEDRAAIALVPISIRFNTALRGTALALFGGRLRYLHGINNADPPDDPRVWLAEIERILRQDRFDDERLLVVLDGADEAVGWSVGQDLAFPPYSVRNIKVLLTARPLADCDAAGWQRRLNWTGLCQWFELQPMARPGAAQILRSAGGAVAKLADDIALLDEFVRLSEGDPLLLRLYLDSLIVEGSLAGFIKRDELTRIPPGLDAYFDRWWEDQRSQWGASTPLREPLVRTLFQLLACARGPLSTADILALAPELSLDSLAVNEALRPLARFVAGDGQRRGYVFSHPRLGHYFREDNLTMAEQRDWEDRFLAYGSATVAALQAERLRPDDVSEYVLRYYGHHLETVGAEPEDFDVLATEKWLRAWDKLEGTSAGFLADVDRGWRQAAQADAAEADLAERGALIARQTRAALITGSINSRAARLPPGLVAIAVERGMWTPTQGLDRVTHLPDTRGRLEGIAALSAHLPPDLLRQAGAMTSRANAGLDRRSLSYPHLAELVAHVAGQLARRYLALGSPEEALVASRQICPPNSLHWPRAVREQTATAIDLAERVPLVLLDQVLAIARDTHDVWDREAILLACIPRVPAHLIGDCLAQVRDLGAPAWLRPLEALRLRLPPLLLNEALSAARGAMVEWRAQSLIALADALPEADRSFLLAEAEAEAAARSIESPDNLPVTLAWLGCHMQSPDGERLVAEGRALTLAQPDPQLRVETLVRLVDRAPADQRSSLLSDALAAARAIREPNTLGRALARLLPHLPEPLGEDIQVWAVATAEGMSDVDQRWGMLSLLIPRLEPALLDRIGTILQSADLQISQLDAQFACRLAECGRLNEALAMVRRTRRFDRGDAMQELVRFLVRSGQAAAALEALDKLDARWQKLETLADLAPHVSEDLLREALQAIRWTAFDYEEDVFGRPREGVSALAPHLPDDLIQVALREFSGVADREQQQEFLLTCASLSGGSVDDWAPRQTVLGHAEVAAASREADHEQKYGWVTWKLNSEESVSVHIQRLARRSVKMRTWSQPSQTPGKNWISQELIDEWRADLTRLTPPNLAEQVGPWDAQEYVASVFAVLSRCERSQQVDWGALGQLVADIPDDTLRELYAFAAPEDPSVSLSRSSAIQRRLVVELARRANSSDALDVVESFGGNLAETREVMLDLAPLLSHEALNELLWQMTRELVSLGSWTRLFIGVAPLLSGETLDAALMIAIRIVRAGGEATALAALAALAGGLTAEEQRTALAEALAATIEVENPTRRLSRLRRLSAFLPPAELETALTNALATARAFEDGLDRVGAVQSLLALIPEGGRAAVLDEVVSEAQAIPDVFERVQGFVQLGGDVHRLLLHDAPLAIATISDPIKHELALQQLYEQLLGLCYVAEADRVLIDLGRFTHWFVPWWSIDGAAGRIWSTTQAQQFLSSLSRWDERVHAAPQLITLLSKRELAGVLDEIKEAVRRSPSNSFATRLMLTLAERGYVDEALELLNVCPEQGIMSHDEVAWRLARQLATVGRLQGAIGLARSIHKPFFRAGALLSVASYAPEGDRAGVVQEGLTVSRSIDPETLPPSRTPGMLIQSARHWAAQDDSLVEDIDARAQMLVHVAKLLDGPDQLAALAEAEAEARALTPPDAREQVLAGLCARLAEMGHSMRGLELARELVEPRARAEALIAVIPSLPRPDRLSAIDDWLDAAALCDDPEMRAEILKTPDLLLELDGLYDRAAYHLWSKRLRLLAGCTRSQILEDLTRFLPVLLRVGGEAALVGTAAAVVEVARWFP